MLDWHGHISQGMNLVSKGPLVPMLVSSLYFADSLSPEQIADLRLAASKMTGAPRRAFEAEMAFKYCQGHPLWAATVLGWNRQTVA
jgi:hypothetical protein